MIWLLALLIIFWRPTYYLVRYFMNVNKDKELANIYMSGIKAWFKILWELVAPGDIKS